MSYLPAILRLTYLDEGERKPFERPAASLELVYGGGRVRLWRPDQPGAPDRGISFAHLSLEDGELHANDELLPQARIENERGGDVELEVGDKSFSSAYFELGALSLDSGLVLALYQADGERVGWYSGDNSWCAVGEQAPDKPFAPALFSAAFSQAPFEQQTRSRTSALAES